jgi:putative phosphoribosyl transferase
MFSNQTQAGQMLGTQLFELLEATPGFRRQDCLVIGLPRGGVPVAVEVAKILSCPFDILVSKKIGAPVNPELGIGAVTSAGDVVINQRLSLQVGADEEYIKRQVEILTRRTEEVEQGFLKAAGIKQRPVRQGKIIIVVDDGIAVGVTAMAALRTLKKQQASKIIVAAPVMSLDGAYKLQSQCGRVVALMVSQSFMSISQFYSDFRQVEDAEVIKALAESTVSPV